MKKVLVIAYHFPPMTVSSGIHRTLSFVRHLRDHGWESVVLTVTPRAYSAVGDEQLSDIPKGMRVERAFALDTARHLSLGGRYPGFLANPDRWASWIPFALHLGRRLIDEVEPAAIFSTYPIASAHLIGAKLAVRSGLPWIADFRDSMYDDDYPTEGRQRDIHQMLDRRVVYNSRACVFTTRSTLDMYARRYPDLPRDHWAVIPNGYEESAFHGLGNGDPKREHYGSSPLLLLHAGTLYPIERDPMPFFRALQKLKHQGGIDARRLQIRLRATGFDAQYRRATKELGIDDIVAVLDSLPYRAALEEMSQADGLLLFQAQGCNHQVPAKVYEYLRVARPILALTHVDGDTAAVLRDAHADNLLPIDDEKTLLGRLPQMLDELERGKLRTIPPDRIRCYSRQQGAAELAKLLNVVA